MPRDDTSLTYVIRPDIAAGQHFDVGLPTRFLSDDGLCAIDIRTKRAYEQALVYGDSAENVRISDAAHMLLDQCVLSLRQGGSVTGFSPRNLLIITVFKCHPSVVCDPAPPRPPIPIFCERVLQKMSARTQVDPFAINLPRSTIRYTKLPKSLSFRESCFRFKALVFFEQYIGAVTADMYGSSSTIGSWVFSQR